MAPADDLDAPRAAARAVIADLRAELEGILTAQQAEPPDDEHDVEGSSVGFERARVTALLAHAEQRLADLDAARERVIAGTFGRCVTCGGAIDPERLVAIPTARQCAGCASAPPPSRMRSPR